MTLEDLEKYIQNAKDNWTEKDEQFLGAIQHQGIYMLGEKSGVAPVTISYDAQLGFIFNMAKPS